MKKIFVMLAEGFEEIEVVTPVDLLRRAGVECKLISILDTLQVRGAHGIGFHADMLFHECDWDTADGILLPGGMPGTTNLQQHEGLYHVLKKFDHERKYLCAICAAPMILGSMGILSGKKCTIFPGMEHHLLGAKVSLEDVCVDGHIITSRAPGTAMAFALELIEVFAGARKKETIKKQIVF